jgi:hypothetical protein
VKEIQDEEGNKQGQREDYSNLGVKGVHPFMPFQCEDCWMYHLEGRMPVKHEDDMYVMCIRRANLDAMWGAALTANPPQGPVPITDNDGMGLAVELLCTSLTENPKMKQDESHVQLFRKWQRRLETHRSLWESSPLGISKRYEESSWFKLFLLGAKTRMELI